MPPPQNFFLILALRMVSFGAFWVVFLKIELSVLHAKISVLRFPKLAAYAVPQGLHVGLETYTYRGAGSGGLWVADFFGPASSPPPRRLRCQRCWFVSM